MRERRRSDRTLKRLQHDDGWVEVRQSADRRSLWFDDGVLQTEIDLSRPGHLPNPANRAMLAHLMFVRPPRRVLLAGCGGGGIARWFRHRSAQTEGVAVEVSAAIAGLAHDWFDFPATTDGWQLETGDIRDFLPRANRVFDFILFDIAVAGHTPEWLTDTGTLSQVRRRLSARGVATFNLLPRDAPDLGTMLLRVRDVFAQQALCLSVPAHDNIIVMAFKHPPSVDALDDRALAQKQLWGIEFDQFLDRLRQENPPGSGIF